MSNETLFKATMPPNTTLTSRTASRGWPCAACALMRDKFHQAVAIARSPNLPLVLP